MLRVAKSMGGYFVMDLTKSRGRPKSKNPKSHSYRIRLDNEDWQALQYLLKQTDVKVPDLFRNAIHLAAKDRALED